MQNYKIVFSYDGTDFCGWQTQPNGVSIQTTLINTFAHAFKHNATIVAASRTDSGVHAKGAIARVSTSLNLPETEILKTWNRVLPKSISIKFIKKVDNSFHPLKNVKQKTYTYTLFFKRPNPFVARYGWYYRFIDNIDIKKFQSALKLYLGTHDFGSFCKMDKTDKRSTIKKIDSINIKKNNKLNIIIITIKGKSFLRFQIRRMVGYALDLSRQKDKPLSYLKNILDNPDPNQTLSKADSCGLCLERVVYNDKSNKKYIK